MNSKDKSRLPQRTGRGIILHPSSFILAATALLLASCGFHLRGQADLPFESMYIMGSPSFAVPLARAVRAGSKTRITTNPKEADVTLQILSELRDRSILSLSSTGRVQELQIRYRVSFRVYDQKGREYVAPNEILLKRDLLYSDADVLGKEQEEALLYRDMQNDAVQQLVRRLQAVAKAGAKAAEKAGDKS
jgi:LPS-assembly lipoprotein